MLRFFLTLCFALLNSPLCADKLGEAGVLLPAGAKAVWALSPVKVLPATCRFEIDKQGDIWLLPVPRLLSRVDGVGMLLEEDVHDLAFDGGTLMLSSDLAAGAVRLHKQKKGFTGKVQRKLLLPAPHWRLAKDPIDGVAAFGFDADAGKSFLFRLSDKRKVLEWPERVLAAVGTDEAWFLATPSGIQRISRSGSVQNWGSLPGGVSSLAWVSGVGLAAAGPEGAGLFTAAGKLTPLLQAKAPRVRAKDDALYILLPDPGGVLKVTGLGR